MEFFPSRFANLRRPQAGAVITVTLLVIGWCLFGALTQEVLPTAPSTDVQEPKPDSLYYFNVVERVRGGQNYYEAAKAEFDRPFWSANGFRPTSLFNWRTPIYAWLLAALPGETNAEAAAAGLALVAAVFCFLALARVQGPAAAFLSVLLIFPFAWCVNAARVYTFTELWAGILIALSVAAYALERWPVALAAALAALFLRELVLPYCLLCLALALGQRRWREVLAWALGIGLFALFFAWHIQRVREQIGGEASTRVDTWLRFGGTAFVLATVQLGNVLLTLLPAAFSAIVLPLALLGLAGWRGEAGIRPFLTCIGYLLFFSIAGQPPYNAYWGLLIGPLLMLGIAGLPNAIRDLVVILYNGKVASCQLSVVSKDT